MSENVTLATRMRAFEDTHKRVLPRRTYTVIRVDGRGFSSYTRGLDKPFDAQFADDMTATALVMCAEVAGTVTGYVASDEISLVLTDFARESTQPWLGGNVAKMISLSAATATAHFNARRPGSVATFDSRVFTLPDRAAVGAYLLWRQRDTRRNAISMAARAHFSHKQLHGLSGAQMVERLSGAGVNFADYDARFREGQLLARVPGTEEVSFVHGRTGKQQTLTVETNPWAAAVCPDLGDPAGWDAALTAVPEHPDA